MIRIPVSKTQFAIAVTAVVAAIVGLLEVLGVAIFTQAL